MITVLGRRKSLPRWALVGKPLTENIFLPTGEISTGWRAVDFFRGP